ncbi:hypothetical protein BCR42DRAFT_447988 [Absidia repens]|uniref:Uncharacterized protein n=1 Tax=Absidia repens TaxID=90262 RepID=A0A1X2IRD8_9FUNG|nr:hypothetical protein BCR42DRAFT_447988 [Absidia repens]
MDHQYSNLFLMQHLSSISHQKIYPTIPIKIEMPLWKTLHITRLWNNAREQEIYLTQQQQKNDWWIHQMADSNRASFQSLDNYLPPSWLDDSASTTSTIDSTTSEHINCEPRPPHHDTTANDGIDLVHDDDDDDDEEEDSDTMGTTVEPSSPTHATVEKLSTENELTSLLVVSNQGRKRKHEEDLADTQINRTPPATRAATTTTTTTTPSSPMVKV